MRVALSVSLMGYLILSGCAGVRVDPFGAPPKGATMNCGPEYRYKYDVEIKSKEDFIRFIDSHGAELKDRYGRSDVYLDNFRTIERGMSPEAIARAPVNWILVLDAVTTETLAGRTIYSLEFSSFGCIPGSYTLKATSDGHVSLYGCCGF